MKEREVELEGVKVVYVMVIGDVVKIVYDVVKVWVKLFYEVNGVLMVCIKELESLLKNVMVLEKEKGILINDVDGILVFFV